MDSEEEYLRIPDEADGIQVNFCKNVKCPNFGVPASTEQQPRGSKVYEGGRDTYTVSGAGGHGGYTATIRCNLCRETPPLKSNAAIVEEVSGLSFYLTEAPITCPNEDCDNHSVDLRANKSAYRPYGKTKAGSQRYLCRLCHRTFIIGPPAPKHQNFETEEYKRKLQALLDSLKEPSEERIANAHRRCGIHSNIPTCCIEFYITRWRGHDMYKCWTGRVYRFLISFWYPPQRSPAYVPCPKCLLKRYAQPLHECDRKVALARLEECNPTGRILGFDHDRRPSHLPASSSFKERFLRRFGMERVEMTIDYDSKDVDPVTGVIKGRVVGFCAPSLQDSAANESSRSRITVIFTKVMRAMSSRFLRKISSED
jgi:hypothetical protein